jgi:hypothetical protein
VDKLSKERSAKLVKTWPYMRARYAHVMLARDHVRLCNTTKTTHFQHYRACPSTVIIESREYASARVLGGGKGAGARYYDMKYKVCAND